MRTSQLGWMSMAALLGLAALGCESGGVGDPCVPEDEYIADFSGYAATEVNVESRSFQCETRLCLVNHFRGRVSCPYGQTVATNGSEPPESEKRCRIPGTNEPITVDVQSQLVERRADRAVYCSCRCDGADSNARYCECPSGYSCEKILTTNGLGRNELAGSYCIKTGTKYDPANAPDVGCNLGSKNCGSENN